MHPAEKKKVMLSELGKLFAGATVPFIQYLEKIGFKFDIKDEKGSTVLMTAVACADTAAAAYLVQNRKKFSIDIDEIDQEGFYALSYALRERNAGLVEVLLRANAFVAQADKPLLCNFTVVAKGQNGKHLPEENSKFINQL